MHNHTNSHIHNHHLTHQTSTGMIIQDLTSTYPLPDLYLIESMHDTLNGTRLHATHTHTHASTHARDQQIKQRGDNSHLAIQRSVCFIVKAAILPNLPRSRGVLSIGRHYLTPT